MNDTLTATEYSALVGRFADNAMASFQEIIQSPEAIEYAGNDVRGHAYDLVDENMWEEIIGFGSPLDMGLRNGCEDIYALSILLLSNHRHQGVTSERALRHASVCKGIGALLVDEQRNAIDYRYMAASAMHADVMIGLMSRIRVHDDAEKREAVAVPFE